MLSEILSKDTCGKCRFCCAFKRASLWETPLFSDSDKKSLEEKYPQAQFKKCGDSAYTIDLDSAYKSENPQEEAACYFLNPEKGCILPKDEKPFDCAIWPFRLMKKDEALVIALTPTCPAINQIPEETLRDFVAKNLAKKVFAQGKRTPFIIKEYKAGFPVMAQSEQETQ